MSPEGNCWTTSRGPGNQDDPGPSISLQVLSSLHAPVPGGVTSEGHLGCGNQDPYFAGSNDSEADSTAQAGSLCTPAFCSSRPLHIDTLTLKIREQVIEFNMLKVEPVRTEIQTADVPSKALGSIAHWRHSRVLLGLPDPEAGKDFKIRRAGTETDSPSPGPKEVLSQTGSATG